MLRTINDRHYNVRQQNNFILNYSKLVQNRIYKIIFNKIRDAVSGIKLN